MKKIVLIEDDSDLYSLIQYNLEKEGFTMAGSQTGKGALELCRRERPDLIILDIMLPDSDGFEICKAIRAHSDLAPVPVIFLTARASKPTASWASARRQRLYRQAVLHPRIDRAHQDSLSRPGFDHEDSPLGRSRTGQWPLPGSSG
jgi:CheY-like chemotaxis protein